jgi:hypothetical protein
VKKVGLGLLVWTVLSVPLGILVGKVLKARGEQWENADPPEPPDWVNKASQDRPEPRVVRVFPENGASPELKVIKDRPVQPDP